MYNTIAGECATMHVSIKLKHIAGNQGLIQGMTYTWVHAFIWQNFNELFWEFNYILILNTNASIYITKRKKKEKKVNITVEKNKVFYIRRYNSKKLKITRDNLTCIINMKWITCSWLFKTKESMLLLSFSIAVLRVLFDSVFGSVKICFFHSRVTVSWKTALPQP